MSVVDTPEGAIVDFGQVIAGRVRLRLRDTEPGQRIVIEHTETLAADGSWFANIVGINKEQTDVFVAAGGDDRVGAGVHVPRVPVRARLRVSARRCAPTTSSPW